MLLRSRKYHREVHYQIKIIERPGKSEGWRKSEKKRGISIVTHFGKQCEAQHSEILTFLISETSLDLLRRVGKSANREQPLTR